MRLVFVLLISSFWLWAETINGFGSALNDFENGKFKNSYEKFKLLFEKDSDNAEINFFLGRSAYELGLYENALSAYDRVLITNAKHYRTRLELGRVYLKLGDLDAAKVEFYDVLAADVPKSVKKNIAILLEKIEKSRTKHKFNAMLKLGAGYDTNVNANPGQTELLNYLSDQFDLTGQNARADSVLKDSFTHETLHVSHIYDGGMRGRYYLNSSALVYNQNHNRHSAFDILYMKASTALSNRMDRYEWSLPLEVDKFMYGSDALLHSYALAPNISYKVDNTSKLNVWAKVRRKIYDKSVNYGRDSEVKELGINWIKKYKDSSFSAGIGYLNEDKTKSASNEPYIDKKVYTAKFGYGRPIGETYLSAQYTYRNFDFTDVIGPKSLQKREDDYNGLFISLAREIFKAYNVELSYQYINNKSNYQPTDYDKQIVSLSMVHYF